MVMLSPGDRNSNAIALFLIAFWMASYQSEVEVTWSICNASSAVLGRFMPNLCAVVI